MTVVAVTGARGFLGWHTRVLIHARGGVETRAIDRKILDDSRALAAAIDGADHFVHIAGVNRGTDEEVLEQNLRLARQTAHALTMAVAPPRSVSFANSIQSGRATAYGQGKAGAAEILGRTCGALGIDFDDVRLPNLFGEHGRPHYNSVVATFCHEIAHDRVPTPRDDNELTLLGVRDAASLLLAPAYGKKSSGSETTSITVSELLGLLLEYHSRYRTGDIPDIGTRFRTQLFNAFRSYGFPWRYPIALKKHSDERGALVETVRVHGTGGQAFMSTTRPGSTRGQHYHLDKIERFVVVEGAAAISLRRVLYDDVVRFTVDGRSPVVIDMPTLWTHNISNIGESTLYTQFWSDQLFDPASPDTYYEEV